MTVLTVISKLPLDGDYEPTGDVLYLSDGTPRDGVTHATPEGHSVRLADGDGRVSGITFVNARWLLERDGSITATLPDGRRFELPGPEAHRLLG